MYLKNRSRAKIKLQYYRCQEYSFNARSLEFKIILSHQQSTKILTLKLTITLKQQKSRQKFSNKVKRALKKLMTEKSKVICSVDTDKNLGAALANKSDINKECRRQLYNHNGAKTSLIRIIRFQLKSIIKNIFTKEIVPLKMRNSYCPIWRDIKFHIFISSGRFWKIP